MADYSSSDRRRAEEYVGNLFRRDHSRRDGFDEGFSLLDVQRDARQFRFELDLIIRVGARVPALKVSDGPPVPMSLASLGMFGAGIHIYSSLFYRGVERELRESLVELEDTDAYDTLSPEEAQYSFRERAADFLATRIAAVRKWSAGHREGVQLRIPASIGMAPSQVPGCQFSVSSTTASLTVYWSGAYLVSPNYFGHPTSPAHSILQAGTYIFGVAGGAYGSQPQWDRNAVCSLPGVPSVHLNF